MITAVLLAYYPERAENLRKIYDALVNGSVVPDRIVIVNNNKDLRFPYCETINNSKNLGHRARFIHALSISSDYYFFIDDDMCVSKDTLKQYSDSAMILSFKNFCLTQAGKTLVENGKYASSKVIWGSQIKHMMLVDMVVGVGSMFCTQEALINMLILDMKLRHDPIWNNGREADLVLGMANHSYVVPTDKDSAVFKIGENGVAMSKEKDHVVMRNQLVELVKRVRVN